MKGHLKDRQRELEELYPKWEKKTIWGFFESTAGRHPDQEFFVTQEGVHYTYRETREQVISIARGLTAMGIGSGDHVAVHLTNIPEHIFLGLALMAIQAVHIHINPRLGNRELEYMLRQSDADCLVTNSQANLTAESHRLRLVITLPTAHCVTNRPVIPWEVLLNCEAQRILLPDSGGEAADKIANILFTSGSTSAPKGVPLTHDMSMRSVYANALFRGAEIGRRIFVPLPLCHSFGFVKGVLTAILIGGTVLLGNGKFCTDGALDFLQSARANDLLCVPVQMIEMIKELERHPREFPELHAVFCTASICPPWVWPKIRKVFHVSDVTTSYGMSEVSGSTTLTLPTDGDDILCSRVGKLLPGGCAGFPEYGGHLLEYRVVDPGTLEALPKGKPGELICRGPVVISSYYRRPECDAESFTLDGWFRTGDCGYFDDDGYLILTDRKDDMYKINGENVSPKFLERIITACPAVELVNIVGIPSQRYGYVGVAFIQLTEDTPKNRKRVEEYCETELAKFQIPRHFVYMSEDDWPRTSTGKIQKFHLREQGITFVDSAEQKSLKG